jgi:hypothetical protein
MSDSPQSEIILYQTQDGETLWLTQAQIAELFDTTPQNVTLHLKNIFSEGELAETATCKDYLQVRFEGARGIQAAAPLSFGGHSRHWFPCAKPSGLLLGKRINE